MTVPLVFEPGPLCDLIKKVAKTEDKMVGLSLTKDEKADIYDLEYNDMHEVGVSAQIVKVVSIESGGCQVFFNIMNRIQLVKEVEKKKENIYAEVVTHHEKSGGEESKVVKAYVASVVLTIKELLKLNPIYKDELQIFVSHVEFIEIAKLCDFASALTVASREELQEILEAFDIEKRIDLTLKLVKKELEVTVLQARIHQSIDVEVSKNQKEYYLKEQLKAIKKELGLEKDEKTQEIEKFQARIDELEIPEEALKLIEEEIEKLNLLETYSSEFSVTRNFLEVITTLPWGIYTEDQLDLTQVRDVLEADHYGLKDVKKRLIEYISVTKLKEITSRSDNRVSRGGIICFVGPPGVGKTSLGKSIARALGREFANFAVGGVSDPSELYGHRRTYVGAMPGRLIQAMKKCGSSNPVILIDEVDKLARGHQGDPAAALLAILDPEQNNNFVDHYVEAGFDLSNVLFIVTANTLETIPGPLLDRMEVIDIAGYMESEKLQIAKKYLIPRIFEKTGLRKKDCRLHDTAVKEVIHGYARESGVRNLEKYLSKIARGVATEVVFDYEKAKGKKKQFPCRVVKKEDVTEYLGNPYFTSERFHGDNPPCGVIMGLAYTSYGGATLYVESSSNPSSGGKASVKLTGMAGKVMNESVEIAANYVLSNIDKYASKENAEKIVKHDIHLHLPAGATPKDGPSAGITMATSIISMIDQRPVSADIAMTGELSLTGQVLPIGGLKEKVLAARSEGVKEVICPAENKRDWEKLPDELKKGLKIHFCSNYEQVYNVVFKKKRKKAANGKATPKKRAKRRKST